MRRSWQGGGSEDEDSTISSLYKHDRIPHILHRIYLPGEGAWEKEVRSPGGKFKGQWRRGCHAHHKHWEIKFWDNAAGEKLLKEEYSWFLQTYQNYERNIERSHALRVFVLHAFGGLYLDLVSMTLCLLFLFLS